MGTIRVARRDRYTAIDRRTINDAHLSYRARGILAWLLDKPDNWSTDSDAIARASEPEGREAVRAALRELAAHGYLVREKHQRAGGLWTTETTVYERPVSESSESTDDGFPVPGATRANAPSAQVAPGTGKPTPGKPTPGNPSLSTEALKSSTDEQIDRTTFEAHLTAGRAAIERARPPRRKDHHR